MWGIPGDCFGRLGDLAMTKGGVIAVSRSPEQSEGAARNPSPSFLRPSAEGLATAEAPRNDERGARFLRSLCSLRMTDYFYDLPEGNRPSGFA